MIHGPNVFHISTPASLNNFFFSHMASNSMRWKYKSFRVFSFSTLPTRALIHSRSPFWLPNRSAGRKNGKFNGLLHLNLYFSTPHLKIKKKIPREMTKKGKNLWHKNSSQKCDTCAKNLPLIHVHVSLAFSPTCTSISITNKCHWRLPFQKKIQSLGLERK